MQTEMMKESNIEIRRVKDRYGETDGFDLSTFVWSVLQLLGLDSSRMRPDNMPLNGSTNNSILD